MIKDENILIAWESLEHEEIPKSNRWYVIVGLIVIVAIIVSVLLNNLLFAIIFLIGGGLFMFLSKTPPQVLQIKIGNNGIEVSDKYFEYSKADSFSIVHRPAKDEYRLLLVVHGKIRSIINLPVPGDIDLNEVAEIIGERVEYDEGLKESASDHIAGILGF